MKNIIVREGLIVIISFMISFTLATIFLFYLFSNANPKTTVANFIFAHTVVFLLVYFPTLLSFHITRFILWAMRKVRAK